MGYSLRKCILAGALIVELAADVIIPNWKKKKNDVYIYIYIQKDMSISCCS